MAQLPGVPLVTLSALADQGLDKLRDAVFASYERWNRRVPTPALNRWLAEAMDRHTPPATRGRRIKIRFMTQPSARPPTFVAFCSQADALPKAYLRYLTNSLRHAFDLPGVPIRFKFRKGDNPYDKGREKRLPASGERARERQPPMTEVLFYHLEHQPLERALPALVERTLARGWRAVVQAGSEERVEALDTLLWTYTEESFLPHGTKRDGNAAEQPVYLTTEESNPNGATVRFLVDGAEISEHAGYERIVYMFDGHDTGAVERAREQWKAAKAAGCEIAYWQQSPEGRWEKKA